MDHFDDWSLLLVILICYEVTTVIHIFFQMKKLRCKKAVIGDT